MAEYIGKLSDDRLASCSRLAAIMGLSKYSTYIDELIKSVKAIDAGQARIDRGEAPISEPAAWGIKFENPILEEGCKRLGLKMNPSVTEVYKADDLELQFSADAELFGDGRVIEHNPSKGIYVCNPSGKIKLEGSGVGEAKATGARPTTEPAPYRGLWQVHGGMMCTGWKWGAIFTLFGVMELRIFLLEWDDTMNQHIRKHVIDFTSRLEGYKRNGVIDYPPAMSPDDGAAAYATAEEDAPEIELDSTGSDLAYQIIEARKTIRACEEIVAGATSSLMDTMGNHTRARYQDKLELTWGKTKARKEYTVKARPEARAKSIRIKEIDHAE